MLQLLSTSRLAMPQLLPTVVLKMRQEGRVGLTADRQGLAGTWHQMEFCLSTLGGTISQAPAVHISGSTRPSAKNTN